MANPKGKRTKKKTRRVDQHGVAHIKSTFNNTIISITDSTGAVISWSSAGKSGFKGSKKSTPFAAQLAASSSAKEAIDQGLRKIEVWVKGPGSGREAANAEPRASCCVGVPPVGGGGAARRAGSR